VDDVIVEIPVEGEGENEMAMAEGSLADGSVMAAVMTGMAADAAAGASRRTGRFDQLAADSASMWAVALTTPTVMANMGFRVAQQSGGYPAKSGTGTGE
jgi:hypothetical protein